MSKILKFNRLFIFSEKQQKCFYCEFKDGINIIHGANTSGKSTLIQTLLYMFGINDVKRYLDSIYTSDFILRLDISVVNQDIETSASIIRNDGFIYIKIGNQPLVSFNGVTGNNSFEHGRLKSLFRELFSFNLMLLHNNEYKEASIETMFLPYYISQAVGWVSIRKTFDGLDFYKNFKEDFLDYYLGINNSDDVIEKIKLEAEKKNLQITKDILETTIQNEPEIIIANLKSDNYKSKCTEYIIAFTEHEKQLQDYHRNFIKLCNKLEFLNIRLKTLNKIKTNQKTQNPITHGSCPVCNQPLPLTIETAYIYRQKFDDTELEIKKIKEQIKQITANLDSIAKKRDELSKEIEKERSILNKYSEKEVTMEDWINDQANEVLAANIESKKATILKSIDEIDKKLKKFKTVDDIEKNRLSIKKDFKSIFIDYLIKLQVKYSLHSKEERFFDLYKISILPYQGVELLKAMMAYHFAFNNLIKSNINIHRFPFILDAIFKEDIEENNKKIILEFIRDNYPKDTQLIFSMADKSESKNQINAVEVNSLYFCNSANLIHVSDNERSILKDWDDKYNDLKLATISIMENE
ncbi:MAG: hypothetical protein ACLSGQ_09995 [Parabacteroides distasonis]|jgi:uncharacterized coiled-coil DUF342 family protein